MPTSLRPAPSHAGRSQPCGRPRLSARRQFPSSTRPWGKRREAICAKASYQTGPVVKTQIINLGNERRHAGAQGTGASSAATGLEHIPAAARDGGHARERECGSGRGRVCAAAGGVRARGRRSAPDNPRRVGAYAGSARRPPPGDAGPVRMCETPHLLPLHHPPKVQNAVGHAWDFCGLGTFSRAASGHPALPAHATGARHCTHQARVLGVGREAPRSPPCPWI